MATSAGNSAGFTSPAPAHRTAKAIQSRRTCGSRSRRNVSIVAPSSTQQEKLVSQKMVGIQSSGGEQAQNKPAASAARSPARRRASASTSSTVIRLSARFNPISSSAEAVE